MIDDIPDYFRGHRRTRPLERNRPRLHQAEHIVSMLTNNAGFNCNATRVVIQHKEWEQRDQLLQEMRMILAQVPSRTAYYPGAHDRYRTFVSAHPEAEQFGKSTNKELPWTLITGVDPEATDNLCFTTEAFCYERP